MDDILEQPSSEAPPPKLDDNPDEQSSGDEDEGPDWTKLKSVIFVLSNAAFVLNGVQG